MTFRFSPLLFWPLLWLLIATAVAESAADYQLTKIPLPGANGNVGLDYFAYDAATGKLWMPASNLGTVDVIDGKTDAISQITGFVTTEIERRDRKVVVGPTSATVGDGVIFIGNRGDSTLCAVNAKTLEHGACVPVSADKTVTPDGVLWVAPTREVWMTTRPTSPAAVDAAKAIEIFDASDPQHLKWKARVPLENLGEGYAVDAAGGIFYTNVEEVGKTVGIDVRTRKIVAQWNPGTNHLGGLVFDPKHKFLFVSCRDHVVNLDTAHDGKIIDSTTTGAGLDNVDYSPDEKLLYAAAAQAATLTIISVDDSGKFEVRATVPTVNGARSVVSAGGQTAYLIDPVEGCALKVTRK